MMSRLGKNLCCSSSVLSVKYFKGLGLIKNTFWRKVLSCWMDNKQKWSTETPATIALEKQCLWNNSNISYRKQTLLFRDWIDSGFSLVKDILENDNTILTLKTICENVGHKPTRLFEYGAMRTAIEACAARTEPCVENTKLSTDNHAQSVFRPRQFRLRLVEANKTEPTAVNFRRNKCGIRVERKKNRKKIEKSTGH